MQGYGGLPSSEHFCRALVKTVIGCTLQLDLSLFGNLVLFPFLQQVLAVGLLA